MNNRTLVRQNKTFLIGMMIIALSLPLSFTKAQYVAVDMKLMHEKIGTEILPFGFPISKSKEESTKEVNMKTFTGKGIYTVSATENLRVLVSVTYTDKLTDKAKKKVPFEVEMSYQNNGTENEITAKIDNEKHACFELSNSGRLIDQIKTPTNRVSAYVFLYGKISATEVYQYPLKGEITLTAEYE